ncbi:MAG: hypothetical protein H8K05_00095 [Nitrospira sp.]|nr:hypothetical protein [Nitrospira sp.]
MGTYFALMEAAAKHGEDYQDLDHLREILVAAQQGRANTEEVLRVVKQLDLWRNRVNAFLEEAEAPVAEQARKALDRLEGLKSALEASSNVVRT